MRVEETRGRDEKGRRPVLSLVVAATLSCAGANAVRAQAADDVAAANNPLAPITAVNLQNYYVPTIYGSPDSSANSMLIRGVVATKAMILRATLPVSTVSGNGVDTSGLGDLNIFDAFLLPRKGHTQFGVGPLLVCPTSSDDTLGAGKWQAGVAGVVVSTPSPTLMVGGLVTYQHSFANEGSTDHPDTSVLVAQPLLFAQLGGGWYLRSSAVWNLDLENTNWNIPFGLGAGKVMRAGSAVLNFFVEPQFTIAHRGVNQPEIQVFSGINIQFPKEK